MGQGTNKPASCHCEATNLRFGLPESLHVANVEPANAPLQLFQKLQSGSVQSSSEGGSSYQPAIRERSEWKRDREVNVNLWDCIWFVHRICFSQDSAIRFFFFLATTAKHVINTHLSETGMLTWGWHIFCSYRVPLVRRGQWRQYALCCKPPCQNTPLPFRGQPWWLWAAVPSLGGVLSLLWHFPFNLYFLPILTWKPYGMSKFWVFTHPNLALFTSVQYSWNFYIFHNAAFLVRFLETD